MVCPWRVRCGELLTVHSMVLPSRFGRCMPKSAKDVTHAQQIFAHQLEQLQTDYVDMYMLHTIPQDKSVLKDTPRRAIFVCRWITLLVVLSTLTQSLIFIIPLSTAVPLHRKSSMPPPQEPLTDLTCASEP